MDFELKRMVMMPQWLSRLWFGIVCRYLECGTIANVFQPMGSAFFALYMDQTRAHVICVTTNGHRKTSYHSPWCPNVKKNNPKGPSRVPFQLTDCVKGASNRTIVHAGTFFFPQSLKDPQSTTYL